MRFGIVALTPEKARLAQEWNDGGIGYGFSSPHPTEIVHEITTNESDIKKLIAAWQVAGWLFRKSQKKQILIVICPQGTANEYAPQQKLPPKRPDHTVSA